MDVVDCGIRGSEMQFVDIEPAPGEAAIREAGSLPFSRPALRMSAATPQRGGSKDEGSVLGWHRRIAGRVGRRRPT